MIKVAVARAIGVPHGYVKVDATGISVTRRKDYREKSFIPRTAIKHMLQFDKDPTQVKPFSFYLEFRKTSPVYKSTKERREQINKARKGKSQRKYNISERIAGIAVTDWALAKELLCPSDKKTPVH
jgi:hypothetical protein